MDTSHPADSTNFGKVPSGGLRASFAEAAQFWEPRRLIYNLVLTGVALAWVVATWPHFRPAFAWPSVPPLAFLALLANVCYSAAYLVDIPMQQGTVSANRDKFWPRGRWGLWLLGTLLAIVLESYWIADEIYPDFH